MGCRKRKIAALEAEVADLTSRLDRRDYVAACTEKALEAATQECDKLRHQLRDIRTAHEPLHRAIYPDLLKGKA